MMLDFNLQQILKEVKINNNEAGGKRIRSVYVKYFD